MTDDYRKDRIVRSDQMVSIFEMLKTSSWYEKKIAHILKPFDVSHEQYNVLRILSHNHPRSFSLKEIQNRLLNKTANTTRLVEKLRKKGFLICSTQEADRRALRIVISGKGFDGLRRIEKALKGFVDKINKTLDTDDANTVARIMRDIRKIKD